MLNNKKYPWYPPVVHKPPTSFKERAVMGIISMFKAMTPKHRLDFMKHVTGVSKWQLMEYDDNYIMRLKGMATDIRDSERDIAFWDARDSRILKQMDSKTIRAAYDQLKRDAVRDRVEYEANMKLWHDLGYTDDEGNFIPR